MTQWIFIDILAFAIVVILAGFIIPQILLIAFRRNLFDEVDPRKIHQGTVPRLGGIAFFPSILFSMLLVLGFVVLISDSEVSNQFIKNLAPLCFISCGVISLYLIGMADDLIGVKYRAKFVAQIFASLLLIVGGILLDNLHGLLWLNTLPFPFAVLLTLLITVFITNAINLIDGIDGLASGLSGIACAFLGFVCFLIGEHVYAMLAFSTLGALLPFFYYNVFGNAVKHSKIFMGDTGSLTIGLILSALSIKICSTPDIPGINLNLGVAAFSPLLIPCCDVVRVYFRRLRNHRSPFLPDKTHIHHKILALGISQRSAMSIIILSSLLLTIANYVLSNIVNITLLFTLDILLWVTSNMILSKKIAKRNKKLQTHQTSL